MKKIIFILLVISSISACIFYLLKERAQTQHHFMDFVSKQVNLLHHHNFEGRVCVVVFGKFPAAEVALVKRQIIEYYGFSIDSTIVMDLPDSAYHAPRKRYRAIRLLHFLQDIKPKSCDKIIGLTTKDIGAANGRSEYAGILGYGFLGGASCVVSTHRMGKGKVSQAKYRERLSKVVLHEIGHTLGLPHCQDSPICLMNDARGTIKQIDKEKVALCEACTKKIPYIGNVKKVLVSHK